MNARFADRIACLTAVLTFLGVIAAWLVVPGIAERLPWVARRTGKDVAPAQSVISSKASVNAGTSKPQAYSTGRHTITLTSCRRDDDIVMCRGLIRNDTDLYQAPRLCCGLHISTVATLVDSGGMPRITGGCWVGHDHGYRWAAQCIPPRTSIAFAIKFPGVPESATHAQLVEFYFSEDEPKWRSEKMIRVAFHNVAITSRARQWWEW